MALQPIHEETSERCPKRQHLYEAEGETLPGEKNVEGILQALNYLLSTYTTNDITAETDAEITGSKQPSNRNPIEYSQFMLLKALNFGSVHDGSMLKSIFIKILH